MTDPATTHPATTDPATTEATITPGDDQEPAARLRAAGLRATLPRVTVLRWLDGVEGHHRADEVAEATGLARTTAFSVLAQLREHALVHAVDHDRGTLFETGPRHHHATCKVCGSVVDVDATDVHVELPEGVDGMHDVDDYGLVLIGPCDRC